ncbi:D-alanine--D-alanine ligase family protein [Thermodesulforhabdus norvegica]|uniref:D-alanine--D-alanine ligase n=1 Tax=Thermodesulforhabdus norvegica TaxID=39841 RepID=A0A1I4UXV8_9BACT|nr:D-alanine--D-alanine ligase [Thermodesulforhabdus norvegica]SFM93756.1 D-alanine--D-alanine ligase [Thermodesulforhabdus norvegica]
MKKIIAVIAGGTSAEREVSLSSGNQVMAALDRGKYEVLFYDPATDLLKLAHDAGRIDAALIMLHGRGGEDGSMQGFLDVLGIPYQGSGVLGSALAMNKIVSKELYRSAGLPVAPYVVVSRHEPVSPKEIEDLLGFPVMVKPEQEGSSIGLSLVKSPTELEKALEKAFQYDDRCLVEKYLEGTEVTAAVLGNDPPTALPLVEIRPGKDFQFFDYTAKYQPGATEEICPAPLREELTKKAQEYAIKAHKVLCCRDYSRTDMILHDGEFYILETNTIPGMTATSLFPQAARAAGISFSELLDRLIDMALSRKKTG